MQNHLKTIRKSRGLVLWHLATISKINPSLISAIERHNYHPSRAVQVRLADALGVSVSDIWPVKPEQKEANIWQ